MSILRCSISFLLLLSGCFVAFAQSSSSVKPGRQSAQPQMQPTTVAKLELETSEALFSTLTALNACGFDLDLANSDPLRGKVREEVTSAINVSLEASNAREQLCHFYRDKQQPDAARDLAQYVSLALYMKEPPEFGTTIRESDLPPDAYEVLGFIPLLKNFYDATHLHDIWVKHAGDYERLIARVHNPVADLVLKT